DPSRPRGRRRSAAGIVPSPFGGRRLHAVLPAPALAVLPGPTNAVQRKPRDGGRFPRSHWTARERGGHWQRLLLPEPYDQSSEGGLYGSAGGSVSRSWNRSPIA